MSGRHKSLLVVVEDDGDGLCVDGVKAKIVGVSVGRAFGVARGAGNDMGWGDRRL